MARQGTAFKEKPMRRKGSRRYFKHSSQISTQSQPRVLKLTPRTCALTVVAATVPFNAFATFP